MGEMSAYLAAMANVKDVTIDPNTGQTVRNSGKNLLEKNGVDEKVIAEKLPDNIRQQVTEAAAKNKENKSQGEDYVTAYRQMYGMPVKEPQPIVEESPQQERPVHPTQVQQPQSTQQMWNEQYVTKVGHLPNEDAYMALLAKNCKRKY